MQITAWNNAFDTAIAADRLQRLRQVRCSDAVTGDWTQSTATALLRHLVVSRAAVSTGSRLPAPAGTWPAWTQSQSS